MVPSQPLKPEDVVFRMVTRAGKYIPPDAPFPNHEHFRPSSDDEAESIERSLPVRVSVWDLALTTPEQARALRNSEKPSDAWGISVAEVHEVASKFSRPSLRVVRDFEGTPSGDGREGHCGIEGLERKLNEQKALIKSVRDEIARRCKKIDESSADAS